MELFISFDRPLLTLSIPTFNRAQYLEILLKQLSSELLKLEDKDIVELLISDNASVDCTQQVVQNFLSQGLPLRYLRNTENIGSDRNIAQAFNEANGRYVLIMGDDDVLTDGSLALILAKLIQSSPSVLLLRAYGYENDFRSECPIRKGRFIEFKSPGEFLSKAGAQITLISACVIHKEIIESLDAKIYVGESLVQVHLVLRCLLAGTKSIIYNGYAVACKRNNSGGYVYAEVFVKNLGSILDYYSNFGLSRQDISAFENHLLKSHHPYYVWRSIRLDSGGKNFSKSIFDYRYGGRFYYLICVWPIFSLPKPLAWLWGLCSTGLGRVFFGDDLIRGFFFFKNKLMCYFTMDV